MKSLENSSLTTIVKDVRREGIRRVKNFGRDRFRSPSASEWIAEDTSVPKSKKMDLFTPKDAQDELKAIKDRCNKHLHRPHEWLSPGGEKRLIALKEENSDLVRRHININQELTHEEILDLITTAKSYGSALDAHQDRLKEAKKREKKGGTTDEIKNLEKGVQDINNKITLVKARLLVGEREAIN